MPQTKADVFIGSSFEAMDTARKVRDCLSETANCYIWADDFFKVNVSTFDQLCKKLIGFDFAVLIGRKDDLSLVRRDLFDTIRDNVIFEYGLFTGAIGRQRAFLLFERGSRLPTDLNGITLLRFSCDQELEQCCGQLIRIMRDEAKLSRIGMLPSTASAISYYENFVLPICISLSRREPIRSDQQDILYERAELHIVMPADLFRDLKLYADHYYRRHAHRSATMAGVQREYAIHLADGGGKIKIYDIPVILNASQKAIELFTGKDSIGDHPDAALYRKRELRNFQLTLSRLMAEDYLTQKFVRIHEEH